MKNEAAEIYEKLFRSLEEGKKKEERTLVQHLREKYRVPRYRKASDWLAKHVPVEHVFGDIVKHIEPFARILGEIYEFLDSQRTTIRGRADQFAFRFEELKDRVPFGLDSFPKTYIDVVKGGLVDVLSFNPDATGHLLIDTPDCWGETGALQNLGHHAFLYMLDSLLRNAPGHAAPEQFIRANTEVIERTVARVQQVVTASRHGLFYHKESNDALDCIGYGADELHFYYRTSADCDRWEQTVADYNGGKIDSFVVFDRDRELQNSFRRFNLTELHLLLSSWDSYPSRVREHARGEYEPSVPECDRFEHYMEAFDRAFELLFSRRLEPAEVLQRVLDSVILPYWRHRWRLYEVWAVIFTLEQHPKRTEAVPLLAPRDDETDAYEWPIPHGDAKHPVAEIQGSGAKLEIWFQRKTRHLTGTDHIEPDIRVMKPGPSNQDVFLLELKDRHNGSISHVRQVARKYASGSLAKSLCIANYSSFRSADICGKLTTWNVDGKTVLLADQFRPGNIYSDVVHTLQQSIRDGLGYGTGYDLMFDVSGSTGSFNIPEQLAELIRKNGEPRRIYSFTDTLAPHGSTTPGFDVVIGGGTDVPAAISEYFDNEFDNVVAELMVVTDDDGVRQFKDSDIETKSELKLSLVRYGADGTPRIV